VILSLNGTNKNLPLETLCLYTISVLNGEAWHQKSMLSALQGVMIPRQLNWDDARKKRCKHKFFTLPLNMQHFHAVIAIFPEGYDEDEGIGPILTIPYRLNRNSNYHIHESTHFMVEGKPDIFSGIPMLMRPINNITNGSQLQTPPPLSPNQVIEGGPPALNPSRPPPGSGHDERPSTENQMVGRAPPTLHQPRPPPSSGESEQPSPANHVAAGVPPVFNQSRSPSSLANQDAPSTVDDENQDPPLSADDEDMRSSGDEENQEPLVSMDEVDSPKQPLENQATSVLGGNESSSRNHAPPLSVGDQLHRSSHSANNGATDCDGGRDSADGQVRNAMDGEGNGTHDWMISSRNGAYPKLNSRPLQPSSELQPTNDQCRNAMDDEGNETHDRMISSRNGAYPKLNSRPLQHSSELRRTTNPSRRKRCLYIDSGAMLVNRKEARISVEIPASRGDTCLPDALATIVSSILSESEDHSIKAPGGVFIRSRDLAKFFRDSLSPNGEWVKIEEMERFLPTIGFQASQIRGFLACRNKVDVLTRAQGHFWLFAS